MEIQNNSELRDLEPKEWQVWQRVGMTTEEKTVIFKFWGLLSAGWNIPFTEPETTSPESKVKAAPICMGQWKVKWRWRGNTSAWKCAAMSWKQRQRGLSESMWSMNFIREQGEKWVYARRMDQKDSGWFVTYQYKDRTWRHTDHQKGPRWD